MAVSPSVLVNVSGARGESATDQARRLGTFIGAPIDANMSDVEILDAPYSIFNELLAADGYHIINPVRLKSTANVNIASPGTTIFDGVTAANGNRLLLASQTAPAENGIYVFNGSASAMTRATDFDSSGEVLTGSYVVVEEGTISGAYVLVTTGTIVVGTTPQEWRVFRYSSAHKVSYREAITSSATTVDSTLQRLPISPMAFGAKFDGVTDDYPAWQLLWSYVASSGRKSVFCPSGTSLIMGEMSPPDGVTLYGQGPDTILRFMNPSGTAVLSGINPVPNDFCIRDMTLDVDKNGETAIFALLYSADARNILFERVTFTGPGGVNKAGNRGGYIYLGNVFQVTYRDCTFTGLEVCIAKDNSDASFQTNFNFNGITISDCIDGLNINSPLGAWAFGTIKGAFIYEVEQFPIAFAGANCAHWHIEATVRDCDLEAVHFEAECWDMNLKLTANNVNRTSGTSGSPGAINGAVLIIDGSHDITITGFIDVLNNTVYSDPSLPYPLPMGVSIQPGGNTADYTAPDGIHCERLIVRCKAGMYAIFAQNVGLTASQGLTVNLCTFINPNVGTKASAFLLFSGSRVNGAENMFVNPDGIIQIDENSFGVLSNSQFRGDGASNSATKMLLGKTSGGGALNNAQSINFDGWTAHLDNVTSSVTPAIAPICRAPALMNGQFSLRYTRSGSQFIKLADLMLGTNPLAITKEDQIVSGLVDPAPSAPNFTIASGYLNVKLKSTLTYTDGGLVASFKGNFFPVPIMP